MNQPVVFMSANAVYVWCNKGKDKNSNRMCKKLLDGTVKESVYWGCVYKYVGIFTNRAFSLQFGLSSTCRQILWSVLERLNSFLWLFYFVWHHHHLWCETFVFATLSPRATVSHLTTIMLFWTFLAGVFMCLHKSTPLLHWGQEAFYWLFIPV